MLGKAATGAMVGRARKHAKCARPGEVMSDERSDTDGPANSDRRDVLRAAGGAAIGGIAATALAMNTPALAQNSAVASSGAVANRDAAPLGARLQGVQHFGVT